MQAPPEPPERGVQAAKGAAEAELRPLESPELGGEVSGVWNGEDHLADVQLTSHPPRIGVGVRGGIAALCYQILQRGPRQDHQGIVIWLTRSLVVTHRELVEVVAPPYQSPALLCLGYDSNARMTILVSYPGGEV